MPDGHEAELARIFVAQGQIEAQQVRSFLEAEGIAVVERGEALRHTHGLMVDGLGAVEIMVAAADADRASTLLAAAEAGELRLDDSEGR